MSEGEWSVDSAASTAPMTEAGGDDVIDRGLISIATWNIADGRVAGLESAGRALERGGIDIAFVQESKFNDDAYATRYYGAYTILTAATDRVNCGGVSLFYRAGDTFELENALVRGPNCISFELQTGGRGITWWGRTSRRRIWRIVLGRCSARWTRSRKDVF